MKHNICISKMHSVCCRELAQVKQFPNIYIFIASAYHAQAQLTCNPFMLCEIKHASCLGVLITMILF